LNIISVWSDWPIHEQKPAELSQGMRQRVGVPELSRSPQNAPARRAFGMLDSLTRYELQQVLIELWRKDRRPRSW